MLFSSRSKMTVSLVALALTGCAISPTVRGAAINFGDQHQALTAQAARVAFSVHQQLPSGYHVAYLQTLDWDSCTITLTNAAPVTNLTSGAMAAVVTAGVRTATFAFNGVTPAPGYVVTVTLQRAGTTVASGNIPSATINPGPNTVNVPVTITNQNVVSVDPTLTTTDKLTANVATNGYASIGTGPLPRFNGSTTGNTTLGNYQEVSGIDIDASGAAYVSDAKEGRVVSIPPTGAAPTLVAGVAGSNAFTADGPITGATKLNVPRGLVHEAATAGRLALCEFGTTAADGRIRMVIGGSLSTYAGGGAGAVGGTGVDAATIQLNGPSGLCADSAGNLFFIEVGAGLVRRILNATRVIATLDTPGATTAANFGPICIDRTNNVLYYSVGNVIYSLTTPAGVPGVRKTVTTLTAAQLGVLLVTPNNITGLATDGQGLLYAAVGSTTTNPLDSDVRLVRIPVDNTGALVGTAGRSIDVIAGSGAKVTGTSNDVAAQKLDGTTQILGGAMNNLAIDVHGSNGGALSGILYFGNTFAAGAPYGEVLQLFPPTGVAPTGFSKF
jgi:hypothetical protein